MPVLSLKKSNPSALSGSGIVEPEFAEEGLSLVDPTDLNYYRGWNKFRELSDDEKLMLVAARRAFRDADIDPREVDGTRVGVVFGSVFGSFNNYEAFEEGIMEDNLRPSVFSHALANAPASAVSIFWGIQGPCVTLPTDSGGQFDVLNRAHTLLENDLCDLLLVGGWVKSSETYRNYYGENSSSAGAFVLESPEALRQRGKVPYSLLRPDGVDSEVECVFVTESEASSSVEAPEVLEVGADLGIDSPSQISLLTAIAGCTDYARSESTDTFLILSNSAEGTARLDFENVWSG